LTATLCFVAKGIHAALGTQVCVGTGLEVVVVTAWRTRCVKVARWTWCIVARATVVELTGLTWAWALTWLAIAIAYRTVIAWRAIAKLLGALAVARRAITYTVTAHVAVGARGTAAFAALAATACAIATAACGFGVANALHHFTACRFGCSRHHVAAWRLA